MRIARLEIVRFRGFEHLELMPRGSVALIGEPRSGRSDVISAIRRVLDPRALRQRPSEWDVHRPLPVGDDEGHVEGTSVSITLLDLSEAIEQEFDGALELLDPGTGLPTSAENEEAVLGLRLTYRHQFNPEEEDLQHWIEYTKSATRVGRAHRELVRAHVVDRDPPLQLRAEGLLRRLASDHDPEGLANTLETFSDEIGEATDNLAGSPEITAALRLVAQNGPQRLLNIDPSAPTDRIGFAAEDGSMAALLRAIQPMLDLDEAGSLPLRAHGSTTAAILAVAEAAAAARSDGAIVLADDYGDHLDAASAEYLAGGLRRRAGQLWLTTRQPEVQRAFDPSDLVRLTRHRGGRQAHQLSQNPSRKERVQRRQLSTLLAPAISATTVVLVEGPHDYEAYSTLSARQVPARKPPLAALGMRLIAASASGGEGGKQRLPGLARLATDLGMAVRVVLDNDRPGGNKDLIDELTPSVEVLVHLPDRVAVERALVLGIDATSLRHALKALSNEFDLGVDVDAVSDSDLPEKCVWALKQKGGLHGAFLEGLPEGVDPPIAADVLRTLRRAAPTAPLVELAAP